MENNVNDLKRRIQELETELYFCSRNNRIEEITMGKKCCDKKSGCNKSQPMEILTPYPKPRSNKRIKLERYIDRYNHILELIRTILAFATVTLQLIILYRLWN